MIKKYLLILVVVSTLFLFFGAKIYYLLPYVNPVRKDGALDPTLSKNKDVDLYLSPPRGMELSNGVNTLQNPTARIIRGLRPSRDFIKHIGSEEFIEKIKSDLDSAIFDGVIRAIQNEGCKNIYIIQSEEGPAGGIVTKQREIDIYTSISLGESSIPVFPVEGDGLILLPFDFIYNDTTIEEIPERHAILYHELSHILRGLRNPEKAKAFDEVMEAIRQIEREDSLKAKKLWEIFYGLDNLDLVKFQLNLGSTDDIIQARLYTKYKLAKYKNAPVPDKNIAAEIYFIKAYLETVMPFELAIPNARADLQEGFKRNYKENLAELKRIYADYVDAETLIEDFIVGLKQAIIANGAYLMPDEIKRLLSSLLE